MQNSSSFYQTDVLEKGNARLSVLLLFTLAIFGIFFLRLFTLQVVKGQSYKRQAQIISTATKMIPAQRGEIYDRNAVLPMVINTDAFAVRLTPGEIPNGYYDTVATKLAEYLDINKSEIDRKTSGKRNSYESIEIKSSVSFSTISNIAENITDLPGVSWENKPIRNYGFIIFNKEI